MTNIMEVPATPQIPVTKLTLGDRALGSAVTLNVPIQEYDECGFHVDEQTDLAADVFWHNYKSNPERSDNVNASRQGTKALLDWMTSFDGYKSCHDASKHSIPVANASTSVLLKRLMQSDVVQDVMKQQAEAAELEATAQALAAEATASGVRGNDAEAKRLRQEADEVLAEMELQLEGIDQTLASASGDATVKALMGVALSDAKESADETRRMIDGFGTGNSGSLHKNPAEAQQFMRAAASFGDLLAEIVEIAGRVRGAAISAARNTVQTGNPKSSHGRTRRLDRIAPTERAYISDSSPIRNLKLAEFAQSGLRGKVPVKNGDKSGPFIVMVDVSPSTWYDAKVHRLLKGVAFGLAQYARQEGREYMMVSFASNHDNMQIVESSDNWQAHIDMLVNTQDGGTDFDMAMLKAIECFDGFNDKGAVDVVFISDGEGIIGDDVLAKWRDFASNDAKGSRLWFIPCIPTPIDAYALRHYNMWREADEIIPITEISKAAGINAGADVGTRFRR